MEGWRKEDYGREGGREVRREERWKVGWETMIGREREGRRVRGKEGRKL